MEKAGLSSLDWRGEWKSSGISELLSHGHAWALGNDWMDKIMVEMSFRLALREGRGSDIWQELKVEILVFWGERSQLEPGQEASWYLPGKVWWVCPSRGRPWGTHKACCRDYISRLAWEHLGFPLRSWGGGWGQCLGFPAHSYPCDQDLVLDQCLQEKDEEMHYLLYSSWKDRLNIWMNFWYDWTTAVENLNIN